MHRTTPSQDTSSTIGEEVYHLPSIFRHSLLAMCFVVGAAEQVLSEERIDALRTIIRTQLHLLDDRDYFTREEAQEKLEEATNRVLDVRNPFPQELRMAIDPIHNNFSPEQRARLRDIMRVIDRRQMLEPGKIAAPQGCNLPLSAILSKQFRRPLQPESQSLLEKISLFDEGKEGELSADALMRLCNHLNCIPLIKPDCILLVPNTEKANIRWNKDLLRVTRNIDGQHETSLAAIPDKAVILTAGKRDKNDTNNIHIRPLHHWSTEGQYTPPPGAWVADEQSIRAIMGTKPTDGTLMIDSEKPAIIGPQTIRIGSVENTDERTIIELNGWIFEDLPWPKTTVAQDMYSYQLVAANIIRASDAKGEIPVTTENLSFCRRQFKWTISCPRTPDQLTVHGFTMIEERTLAMP